MSNTFLSRPAPSTAAPLSISSLPDDDDDDDAADDDYDDDLLAASSERWSSHAGFGSPQWWS